MSLSESQAPAVAPGARLGPYEILDKIGAGGMGEVYRPGLDRIRHLP